MALIGANPLAIGAQCKTFLVAARNDGFDQGAVEAQAIGVSVGQSNQFIYVCPAGGIQLKADLFGLVAEYQAQEFAEGLH